MGEALLESDPLRAAELLDSAAAHSASVNNQFIQALARTTLGSVLARLGRNDEAISNLQEALGLWNSLGVPTYQWAAVQFLGAILAESGEAELATRLLAAAENAGVAPSAPGKRIGLRWRTSCALLRDTKAGRSSARG